MKRLKYLNICYDVKSINNEFNDFFSSYQDNFFEYEHKNELIELVSKNDIHFVITKYNSEVLKQIRELNQQIQIIAILDEINHTHLLESLEIKYVKFIENLNCINNFIDLLKDCAKNIDSNKSNIIDLGNNFVFDNYNNFLTKNNVMISLTKKEQQLLNLLTKNHNNFLSYEDINREIWEGAMTQDSLRSMIKEIRKKTYKELIKNVSGVGYRIDVQIK